jgi:serine/threonine protein kinase
LIIFNLN